MFPACMYSKTLSVDNLLQTKYTMIRQLRIIIIYKLINIHYMYTSVLDIRPTHVS